MCRLVYYRIRKGEQCFDCRATLWTMVAWKRLECLRIVRPLSPDDWMISRQGTGLWRQHLPGVGAVILPALWRLHEDARKTPASVQERARGAARMFIMRTGCPASVDPGMADAMVAQVITKKIPQLQGLLLQHGILTPFERPIASHRISFEKLTDMRTDHCIVSHVPARVRWQIYVVCFGDPDSFEDLIHALVFHACVLELRRPRQQLLAAVRDCLLQQCALAGIYPKRTLSSCLLHSRTLGDSHVRRDSAAVSCPCTCQF